MLRLCKVQGDVVGLRPTSYFTTTGERGTVAYSTYSRVVYIQYLPNLQLAPRQHATTIQHNMATSNVASRP